MTVEEICEMMEAGDAVGLAQRVSHAGTKLAGSKPFWQSAQKDLIAQIQALDIGTPHVFFTCSSADIQWADMHHHMPNNDPNAAENATSYRTRMNDLNNNPAIAAYYFQKRWQIFFDEVIKPKSKIIGGNMNGNTMEVATSMDFYGWKMHHLWMDLMETMQSLWPPS